MDNHIRPWTGKHVVRKGWRMQDKRLRPGATDYYVHDEAGAPVMRLTAPHHGSLTDFLTPIAATRRLALTEEKVLLAFDSAGAFPEQMRELRDGGTEFVTYERKPYALLPESEFTEELLLDDEQLRWCEPSLRNLGRGRGRVRSICIRTGDGRQVNLPAISSRKAPRLIEVMRGGWRQENGFKHGNERWGFNQLDGRTVVPYAPETIIPNPLRGRLDQALRIWRAREGQLRREPARLAAGGVRRERLQHQLGEAIRRQLQLEALRPTTPVHAALCDTGLAGKLVHHQPEYKIGLDTIRIALRQRGERARDEAGVASFPSGRSEEVPREPARRAGANNVSEMAITVTLQPAGTHNEMRAAAASLNQFNARALKFRVPQSSWASLHEI